MTPCPHRARRVRAIVLSLAVCGCAGGAGAAVYTLPGSPLLLPVVRLADPIHVPPLTPDRIDPPEVHIDEILASPVLSDPEFEAELEVWIDYWGVSASAWFPEYLSGMASFAEAVDSALHVNALPASLRYLPLIESGYNPRASSRASAVGMWQFMQVTATELGMEVTPLLDERRDPVRSTDAAMAFLVDLREDLGSWFLALAAYNGGPSRVRRVLAEHAAGVAPSDSLFWALRRRFPRETRDFIPKLIGAVLVGGNPVDHGYEPPTTDRFSFDAATVPDATTLDVVARAAGVSHAEIERLNPKYLMGMTPPGRVSAVRVPVGRGPTFRSNYAKIPPTERVTYVAHRIVRGETLGDISYRYRVPLAEIRALNPGIRDRYLRIGHVLTVPAAPLASRGDVTAGS